MHTSRLCIRLVQSYCARMHRPLSQVETRFCVSRRWMPASTMQLTSQPYCTDTIPPPPVEGEAKVYPEKIQNLVDEISKLTLIEVADLNELLKKTLNITDTPMMAMGAMPAVAAKAEDEEPAEKKPEKVAFTVKLTGFDEAKKVALIKEIKNVMPGMNLVQAKKFVESSPQTVKAEVTKEEAEALKKALEAVGGKIEVE